MRIFHQLFLVINNFKMNNKTSEEKNIVKQQQLRPNSIINCNKLSHFDFTEYDKYGSVDYRTRKNPRNSFYAQKFKKTQNQNRPISSQPEHTNQNKQDISIPKKQQPKNIGMMGSFYINTKPNTRRLSRSLASYHAEMMIRNASQNISPDKYNLYRGSYYKSQNRQCTHRNVAKKSVNEKMDNNLMEQMSECFTTLKLNTYKRNNSSKIKDRSQIRSENKLRQGERYFVLNYEQNLNIRGLKPNPSSRFSHSIKQLNKKDNSFQKLVTEQIIPIFQVNQMNPKTIIKYRSNFEKQGVKKVLKKSSSPPGITDRNQKLSSPQKKKQSYILNYFGKLKDNSPIEEVQKLKALYYRDIIWKVSFNSNWKVKIESYANGTIQSPKYFVGKGNNSKLVKAIMNRRWWWKIQSKQQNAHFLWTQLKIYSAIQLQIEYKKLCQFQIDDCIIEQKQQIKPQILQESGNCRNKDEQQNSNKQIGLNRIEIAKKIQLLNKQDQQAIYGEEWWNHKLNIPDKNTFLMTHKKYVKWQKYLKNANNLKKQTKWSQNLQNRKLIQNKMQTLQKYPEKVTNHLQYSRLIGNKKALYKTMSIYYQLSKKQSKFLPQTYHITSGLEDQQYLKFLNEYFRKAKQQNNSMWIVKPGEMSNRGCGIKVCKDIQDIKQILKNKKTHANGKPFTYIIQQYLREPFLYQGRKFDIRHYIMINSTFGRIKGYFYQEGYIRTTSYKYSTKNHDSSVHLTNDAVQKYCKEYGKYEKGNKVSYEDFQKYLKNLPDSKGKQYSFYDKILPKIREISIDIMNASYYIIDPKRKGNNFEIFGLDIMIDADFRPWLIQVNTNPCLELSSPVLAKIIPKMLDNAFAISLDPLFPPPTDVALYTKKNNLPDNFINDNLFELVFDEIIEGKKLNRLYDEINNQLTQMDGYGSDEEAYESAEDECDAQY